jgi:predicted RNase H-like HicB family nuclease
MDYAAIMEGSGDVWSLRVPDLPGVHGAGADAAAAIADTISAARDWAEHQASRGVAIPKPRSVPDVTADREVEFMPSCEWVVLIPLILDAGRPVKANVSLDAGTLKAIDAEAARRGVTRSAFMVSAARAAIERGPDRA